MALRVGINGFGRIGRLVVRAAKQRKAPHRLRGGQRSDRCRDARASAQLRQRSPRVGGVSEQARRRRLAHGRGTTDPGARPRRTRRSCRGSRSESRWCSSAPVDSRIAKERRSTSRPGRAPCSSRRPRRVADLTFVMGVNDASVRQVQARDHQHWLLHHERACAGGEGAGRHVRHRARRHDHDPRLHERPEHPGSAPQGPAPRARRGAVDDPHVDRRRQGHRGGAAAAEGQAGRHRRARAGDGRLPGRSRRRRSRSRPTRPGSTPR